ncbi:MAG: PDZ domain-containing protein [Chitinivibrionales bacterium]|nr:PDZ domain-containing protein [Chitinivibrionales bacterium]
MCGPARFFGGPMHTTHTRNPITPLAVLTFIAVTVAPCRATGGRRPKPGSVDFGARSRPAVALDRRFEPCRKLSGDVAEYVLPAVVSVVPVKIDTVLFYRNPFYHFFGEPLFEGNPLDFFFGTPPDNGSEKRGPRIERRAFRQHGLGSGVIVTRDGYVLTSYHVVVGADEIEVRMYNGVQLAATVVGGDSLSDVAVLKIVAEEGSLTPAFLGDSDRLRPGDWIIAVGNPFSLTSTVTAGVVSAMGRSVDQENPFQSYIQTDAAINPGNSGGALVNLYGELVGINTMIYSKHGGYMGISFAIPINIARRVMEDLIYHGRLIRGTIGLRLQEISPEMRTLMSLGSTIGVLVSDIDNDGPCRRCGIVRGDVIIEIDGHRVTGLRDARTRIALLRIGQTTTLTIVRDGAREDIEVDVVRMKAK